MENTQTTDAGKDQATTSTVLDLTQEKLDKIIKEVQGRAGKEYREQAEAAAKKVSELEAQIAEIMASRNSDTTSVDDKDDVKSLRAKIEEMQNAQRTANAQTERLKKELEEKERALDSTKNEAINVKKRVAMNEAAASYGFFDVEEVLDLTDKFVKWDSSSNKFIVIAENGTPRMNTLYEEMSLKEFFQEFAQKKPHLVKSTHRQGVGSTASNSNAELAGAFSVEKVFGKDSDPLVAMKLKKANPTEYSRLREVARSKKLI